MLEYVAHTTRLDSIMSVHQCAPFFEDQKLSHEKAVNRVIKYLIVMNHVGIEETIDFSKGFVAFADSEFANGWSKLDSDNIVNLLSQVGHIVYMFGLPIT